MRSARSILISGASGMLGTALLRKFTKLGYEVCALHNSRPLAFKHDLIRPVQLSFQNRDEISKVFENSKFDVFVHCAAATNLETCESDLSNAVSINVTGTKNLLDALKISGNGLTKVIYISSDAVYPDIEGAKDENTPPDPANIYGLTKLWGEQITRYVFPEALILRTTIVGLDKGQFCSWMMERAKNKKTLPLFSDVCFSPLSVCQLADVIYASILKDAKGVFNAGNSTILTKAEFGEKFLKAMDIEFKIEKSLLSSLSSNVKRSHNMSLDSSRLINALKLPSYDIESTIESLLASIK